MFEPAFRLRTPVERRYAFITTAHRGQNRPGDPQLTTPGVGRADVWVFDTEDLSRAPHIITLFADTPRGLAVSPDGGTVYAAAFRSGNRTTAIHELAVSADPARNDEISDGFTGLGMPPLPEDLPNTTGRTPPQTSIIVQYDGEAWRDAAGRDWTPRLRFQLPDKDVFAIDASADPPRESVYATGVGTVLFNLAVHPVTGNVYVSNLESNNHVRFEPKVREQIAENRVSIVDFGAEEGPNVRPVHLNSHLDFSRPASSPEDVARSLSLPLDLVFTADGEKLYVAAFSSYKVAVLDASGAVQERIDVGGGPSGLALDESRERLYVLNRWSQTISVVDTSVSREIASVSLGFNPEPPAIQEGRRFLYDAPYSSGHGDSSCATCHLFADVDDLAWDLGNPQGNMLPNRTRTQLVGSPTPLRSFHPMKGPMTTQSLRGLKGAGVMHWRGDRNGTAAGGNVFSELESFMEFRPAFVELMGRRTEFPEEDMARFFDFVVSVRYPPNPIANLDGSLTSEQAAGRASFIGNGARNGDGGDGISCGTSCHTGGAGTNRGGVNQNVQTQDFKIAHLRNLYTKVGMFGTPRPRIVRSPLEAEPVPTPHRGDQIRGFGFRHDGVIPTIFDFLREKSIAQVRFPVEVDFNVPVGTPVEPFKFLDRGGRTGDQRARELEAFLLAFNTGLRPIVGQQVTLDGRTLEVRRERFDLMIRGADLRHMDLVGHGLFRGVYRGFLYERKGPFHSDRAGEDFTVEEILGELRAGGAVLTFTAVPRRSGERIGIDRDADGFLDRDEMDRGSDPADPTSTPPEGPRFRRGDTNSDGKVDVSDPVASLDVLFIGQFVPTCLDACDSNDDGKVDITDPVNTLSAIFLGTAGIPLPGTTDCGVDPTEDELGCAMPSEDCR